MYKAIFTILLVCVLSESSYSQTTILKSSDLNSQSIDSCLLWIQANAKTGKGLDEFHAVGLKTLERSLKLGNDSITAQIHESLANWHAYNGLFSPDSVVQHAEQVLAYYLLGNNQKKIADTYRSLSIDYLNTQQLEKAQDVLFKCIAIYEKLEDDAGLGSAYRTLGVLYRVMEDFEKSITYTNKAIPLLEKTENYSAIAIAQFNLIIGYGELGEFEKAYQAADYCLEIVSTKAPEEVYVPMRAYSYRGEVYVKANDYNKALKDYLAAWESCKAQIGEERCATYRTEIGQIYLLQGKYKKALGHLVSGINAYADKEQGGLIQPYLDIAACYTAIGDFKNALLYKDKAYANSERMLEERIESMKSEMAIKYDTDKKDDALISQAALIEQKNKTQTLIVAISSLLFVFLMSLLYFFNKNKKATKIIRAKNAENELLLKEIHHRVKNNLEMVKSLIALQSAQIEDPATKDAMIASQNRVQSMGIIHQKLYQGNNLGSIEMRDYFINLGEGILDTFDAEEKVKIECAMDDLDLDMDTAVPIGLIVNELLTNALKYAFPENEQGTIHISLEKTADNYLKLRVNDNGVGKTEGLAPKGTGFGTQLVELLTQQLNGKMKEHTDKGTHIEFNFLLKQSA
jgi:two-component sensor histidine kinase